MAASGELVVSAPEDAPLSWAHWRLMAVLVVALIIDVMKPAALGFVIPGMIAEYGVPRETVSLVPFFALVGTVFGSFLWGAVADAYGRKARSEEHTSELQSLMRISYAVFCLKKKNEN